MGNEKTIGNWGIVEGPWGNYTFRRVRAEDVDKVIKHIQDHFCHDEQTSALFGYTDEYGEEFGAIIRTLIPENMSFWVEHNETGEVKKIKRIILTSNSRSVKNYY